MYLTIVITVFERFQKLNGIWGEWTGEEILAGSSPIRPRLDTTEEEQIKALSIYGEKLGMAFQIVDDLLPYISSEQATGKPKTSDIKNHRVTLPILYALENSNPAEQDILRAIFQDDSFNGDLVDAHNQVTMFVHSSGAAARAEQTASSLQQVAVEQLQYLPPGEGRNYLEAISQTLLKRKR